MPQLSEKGKFLILLLIMVVVALSASGTAIVVIYRTAMEEERARLRDTVQSQARLIEAVARFDRAHQAQWHPGSGSPREATLSQLRDAHRHYEGFGRTGEFTLAEQQGDRIVFLLRHRHGEVDNPPPVPFDSTLAEPMRQALTGNSGTLIGPDYRGATVLAAFEPVRELNLGIVAKINLEEIRAPFVRAGWISGAGTLVLVVAGAALFTRVTKPILRGLQERAEDLEKEVIERTRAEALFRATFEQAAVGIAHVAPDGRLLRLNRRFCEIIGYGLDEALKLTFQEITHPEDLKGDLAYLRRTLAGEIPAYTMEKRYIRKDESTAWVNLTVSLVKDSSGKPDFLIGVVEDITGKKEAEAALKVAMRDLQASEAQLIQAEKASAVGTMVAGVAHELNNPLTAMLQFAQYARKHMPDGEQAAAVLGDLEAEVKRCIEIVDNLLSFSRNKPEEEGKLADESLLILLERVERLLAYRIREQGVSILKKIDARLPLVPIRSDRIAQVFLNLMLNALDAVSPTPDPEIVIRMGVEGGFVQVSFEDNGIGVPVEDRLLVFDPFFTTKPVGKGTGLGLSVSRGIVESHGGSLHCEDRPGGGTVFRLLLPLRR